MLSADDVRNAKTLTDVLQEYQTEFKRLHTEQSLTEFLKDVPNRLTVFMSAAERVAAAIGVVVKDEYVTYLGSRLPKRAMLTSDSSHGPGAIFGMDDALDSLITNLQQQRRIFALNGPSGTGKSSLIDAIHAQLERFSKDNITTYQIGFPDTQAGSDKPQTIWIGNAVNPLDLIPAPLKLAIARQFFPPSDDVIPPGIRRWLTSKPMGSPELRERFHGLEQNCDGNIQSVLDTIKIRPYIFNNSRGFSTLRREAFQPNERTGQTAEECANEIIKAAQGGILYLEEFGEFAEPELAVVRKFVSEGYIMDRNRPYYVDCVVLAALTKDDLERMMKVESTRTRVIPVNLRYQLAIKDEKKIYERDVESVFFQSERVAPHTLELLATLIVLSRVSSPVKVGLTTHQKVRAYNGEDLGAVKAEEFAREEFARSTSDGLKGLSPKSGQNVLSALLQSAPRDETVGPIELFAVLASQAKSSSSTFSSADINLIKGVFDDKAKAQVRSAWQATFHSFKPTLVKYLFNVKAYVSHQTITNHFTGKQDEPDERFMRSVEVGADVAESTKDVFRQKEVMNRIAGVDLEGISLDHISEPQNEKVFDRLVHALQRTSDAVRASLINDGPQKTDKPSKYESFLERLRVRNLSFDEVRDGAPDTTKPDADLVVLRGIITNLEREYSYPADYAYKVALYAAALK